MFTYPARISILQQDKIHPINFHKSYKIHPKAEQDGILFFNYIYSKIGLSLSYHNAAFSHLIAACSCLNYRQNVLNAWCTSADYPEQHVRW